MSTEVVPEPVLQAFVKTYPDLFPKRDLSNFGLLPDPSAGLPIGFSRRNVPYLGGMSSVGINCAACHVGEINFSAEDQPLRVLGMTSHFDAEAFFGAVAVATWRTSDPANMKRYLANYLAALDPQGGTTLQDLTAKELKRQDKEITGAVADALFGSKGLYNISERDVRFGTGDLEWGRDITPFVSSQLKLFHNMRASLHIPDQPPTNAPPASGPGRNDAFGLLSATLFAAPQPYAPVKYGLVWNLEQRHWVHWDGNTQSPLARNLLAALGLGAPLIGKHGDLDFKLVKRQTDLGELIHAPRYPLNIDEAAAKAGAQHYQARCAACHAGPENDSRLHSVEEIGTDPLRAQLFTPHQAELFDKFLAELKVDGYKPPKVPGIRSTQKYWAPTLAGVWARSPYLHDGSVRTMAELLTTPTERPKSFHRGMHFYDPSVMGYIDEGAYLFDTTKPGNSNSGHNYGTDLSASEKHELIEYLKTL